MPQLDLLILFNTCCENTLFFWLIYFVNIKYILVNINKIFNIRKEIKNNFFFKDNILLNNFYIKNIIFIKNYLITYIVSKEVKIYNIIKNKVVLLLKVNSIISLRNLVFISNQINLNKFLYNYLFILTLKNKN